MEDIPGAVQRGTGQTGEEILAEWGLRRQAIKPETERERLLFL